MANWGNMVTEPPPIDEPPLREPSGPPPRRRRESDPMPAILDRMPPWAEESEKGVLGCILLDPNVSMGICFEKLSGGEVFYDLRHQALYDVLAEMFDKRELIDPIAVQQYLKDRNQLEALGGMPYIAGLMNCVPSAANLEYYLEIIREKYTLRKMIQACTSAVGRIYDAQGNVQELIETTEREVLAAGQGLQNGGEDRSIDQLVTTSFESIDASLRNKGVPQGLLTGFPDFDAMTGGLSGGDMDVIAGRPGTGKTSFVMNMAENVAVQNRWPVGIFSLEMTSAQLTYRMICSRARVDSRRARDGYLDDSEIVKVQRAGEQIRRAPIYICDKSGLSIRQLSARARRMWQRYGIKLVVIDYLQLVQSTIKGENQNVRVAEISAGIKTLAKDLDVPVIVLCQLNRDIEKGNDKGGETRPPRLSDLRDSGAIEQDADLVGFLHPKENPLNEESQSSITAQRVDLVVPKHRNGPVGRIELMFMRTYTRYESASRVEMPPEESTMI